MHVRLYEPGDEAALWDMKERFERELGVIGGDTKEERYDGKLTEEYRNRYTEWVERCVERDPGCVLVADAAGIENADADGGTGTEAFVGYAFVLPEDLAMIWDAAVLNEIYVREAARGNGVAAALMDGALSHARGQDLPLSRMVLDVSPANDRAQAFYERYDFSQWAGMVARDL